MLAFPSPMPAATAPPPKKKPGGIVVPVNLPKRKIRSASMAGATDKDLLRLYPTLNANTLRSWRALDREWQTVFRAMRDDRTGGRRTKRELARHKELEEREADYDKPVLSKAVAAEANQQITTSTLLESILPEISSRNKLRVASLVDKSLADAEKRKKPLPIRTHADLSQAYRTLRLTTGEDSESSQVQVNIWGNPGLNGPAVSPAFRNVTGQTKNVTESADNPAAALGGCAEVN